MANSACKSNIPYTGGRNLWSKLSASLALKRERYSQIRSLAKKVHSGDGSFSDRKWQSLINCKLVSSCHSWGDPAADWNKWLSSADNAIREIRRLERAEQQRMRTLPADSWGQNEIADAHRMLSKGKGELVSVTTIPKRKSSLWMLVSVTLSIVSMRTSPTSTRPGSHL
jgi:hypothetical protein